MSHVTDVYSLAQKSLPQGWTLIAPADYLPLLLNGEFPVAPLGDFLQQVATLKPTKPFRRELEFTGFPILLAVVPQDKKIYAGSRRLSRELVLIDAFEREKEAAAELKAHAAQISTLDAKDFPSEWQWITATEGLLDWSQQSQWNEVEELTKEKLRHLVKHVQTYQPTLFERVSDWGLGLTANFALIRVHLLKFLAVLPSLDHDKKGFEVKRNLTESIRRLLEDDQRLRQKGVKLHATRPLPRIYITGLAVGLGVIRFLPAWLLAAVVRSMVKKMAKRFIAGESIASSDKTLQSLHDTRREATLDQLGELVVSEIEAEEYLKRVLAIVHGLKIHVQPGERNGAGINKAHVSIKVSALASDFKPHAYDFTYKLVAPRLKKILVEAKREQVFVNVDAEHYHYRDLVLKIYRQVLLETPELHGWSDCGIVVQAYLRDGAKHLREVIALARERGVPMPIRLVKGAYWDAETIEAEAHSHHAPQFLNKEESDLHFRQLAGLALEHGKEIQLAVGSHNLQDHCFVEALRQLKYPSAPVIEHQCLHMTYEALSHGLARMGWPTRNYMPIGNLLVGMAYLVRRIMENSSQVGILTIMRSHNKKEAFQTPVETHLEKIKQGILVRDDLEARLESGFKNATPVRLYTDHERHEFEVALTKFKTHLEVKQSEFKSSSLSKVISSSHPDMVVGVIEEQGEAQAVATAQAQYQGMKQNGWTEKPRSFRLGVILKSSDLMWQRRYELAALIVYEAGKTWSEALGDVDEAIDFLNFYVREELRWSETLPGALPRGVTAVIAPWNFPLAIPCGMTCAPLVAGNPVILKPAEQTPLIARELVELLYAAGVPKTALSLICGDGEKVGAPLVKSPHVAAIVFTGSKNVGQWIYRTASVQAVQHPITGAMLPKKVITEMGGKNAIIVTNNCEQDETVSGILYGAFGHAGQKCSACSRVLVDVEVKDALLQRLVKAVEDIEVGASTLPHVLVNPLISADDQARVRKSVQEARAEAEKFGGKVWVDRSTEDYGNFAVGPVLIELPASRATEADSWAQREIFGPVIHLVPYHSLSEAVELFNSTEYGLTGGIYGQSQDDIDYLTKYLKAGNLYVNRPNTGARVAIEPFGGFKLSGTGPKAGGRDYMAQFHVWAVSETSKAEALSWSEGSGFRFELPRPSALSLSGRMVRWNKLAQMILERFEALTGGVGEADKRQLKGFMEWTQQNLQQQVHGTHANQRIPGQLSFDQKDLARDAAVFVVRDAKPSLITLLQLLSALAAGTGVAVVCTSNEAYNTWKGLCEVAWQSGFAKANLEVYLVGKSELASLLQDSGMSVLYVAGQNQFRDEIFAEALPEAGLKHFMRALYHDGEHPPLGNWGMWLDQYLLVRSFAVNTMRHGAPLELGV